MNDSFSVGVVTVVCFSVERAMTTREEPSRIDVFKKKKKTNCLCGPSRWWGHLRRG